MVGREPTLLLSQILDAQECNSWASEWKMVGRGPTLHLNI
jgi:hypothetical protein